MGCFTDLTKYILFIFNFIIVICAIIFIVFGTIIYKTVDKTDDAVGPGRAIGIFAIIIGVIIFFIAFFGCCGAIKENSCLLSTYACILIVLLVLQVVLAILVFTNINDKNKSLHDEVQKNLRKLFDQYSDKDKKTVIDDLQQTLSCCGVDGPLEWNLLNFPSSCCNSTVTICTPINAYKKGCADAFTDALLAGGNIIGGVAIGFAIIELLGAIFACIVRNRN